MGFTIDPDSPLGKGLYSHLSLWEEFKKEIGEEAWKRLGKGQAKENAFNSWKEQKND